jgi:hypothetical protein
VRPRLPERLRASTLFTPQPRVPGAFFLYSDAASDDCGGGGLGGWVHGEWWYFKLTSEDKDMFHITVLELIAAGINVVLYGDLLGGCDVTLCVDALSSAQLIAAGHSHSEAMAVVWGVIQETSQYAALKPLLREAHVYGETNVMSDASSREKFQVIRDVAEQCGVAATRIPLPERALDFVNAVRVATRHLRAEQLHMARVGAHYDEQRPGPLPAREPSAEELAHMQSRERQRSDNEDSDAVLGSGNGAAQDDEAGKPLGARADEAALKACGAAAPLKQNAQRPYPGPPLPMWCAARAHGSGRLQLFASQPLLARCAALRRPFVLLRLTRLATVARASHHGPKPAASSAAWATTLAAAAAAAAAVAASTQPRGRQ